MDRGEELFDAVNRNREWSTIKEIIDTGADVNYKMRRFLGSTPLHVSEDPKITALLIKNGADINALDNRALTPLHCAVSNGWYGTAAALLYFGADPCIPNNNGLTPFMGCFEWTVYGYIPPETWSAMIELLLNFQYNINQVSDYGSSALTLALANESPYINDIVEHGGSFNNLFDDSMLLMNYVSQKMDEFIWLWDGFHYKESWSLHLPLLEMLFGNRHYECFDYVLHSPKIEDIVGDMNIRKGILIHLILSATVNSPDIPPRYSKEKAKEAIFILLSYGYIPTQNDSLAIIKAYGYCDLTELLLHLNEPITYNRPCPLITKIILNPHKCIEEILHQFLAEAKPDVIKDSLITAVDYIFDPKLIQKLEPYYESNQKMLKKLRQRRVPSLIELCRNEARFVIWKGYDIKNVADFYKTLRFMKVPQLIKDIITLNIPLYNYTNVEIQNIIFFYYHRRMP